MSSRFKTRLEEILWRPHETRIKRLQTQLAIKNNAYEKKVHYRILDLITQYEEECLPEELREKFSQKTAEHVLKAEYHGMIM